MVRRSNPNKDVYSYIERYLASVSGAALGFVGGNVPGAVLGWMYAGRIYDCAKGDLYKCDKNPMHWIELGTAFDPLELIDQEPNVIGSKPTNWYSGGSAPVSKKRKRRPVATIGYPNPIPIFTDYPRQNYNKNPKGWKDASGIVYKPLPK